MVIAKLADFVLSDKTLLLGWTRVNKKNFYPCKRDVKATYADTRALEAWVGFKPSTPLQIGVEKFVNWYKHFYS